jgi:two-component system sensor histidine kinase HydH
MNRRIFIQVSMPAVAIGLLLLAVCLASWWYIDRLQRSAATIVSRNVTNLRAAEELEIQVRRLRFHSFLYLLDPKPERRGPIEQDCVKFEDALQRAMDSANNDEVRQHVAVIREEYQAYRMEPDALRHETEGLSRAGLAKFADAHPINRIVEPCQQLVSLNWQIMEDSLQESQHAGDKVSLGLLVLGLAGPAGGLIMGFGIARGLSRSIYQLSVRVQDMAQRLDRDVASISIAADGDIANLDRQLEHVVYRVEEVAERLQRHQREMLRAEQLSAVGQLAASVAHEVRNPLTAVKMLVEVGMRPKNAKSLTADDLRVIHGEIARVERIVQNLLDFARLPEPQTAVCDLRDIIAQSVELVQARARQQHVEIRVHRGDDPVSYEVDRNQFCTVLVNLCLNALDAMPKGGILEINLEAAPGTGVRLTVCDTGPGIAQEMSKRLFTPFASTKATGTGLGLNISQRIVEEHGGRLSGDNRPQGGACFAIWLPARKPSSSGEHDTRPLTGLGSPARPAASGAG